MLLELHVRNLALIEQADVEFGEGLNILTGETGAGKSIIIGSVNLALGQKASKEIIRSGADYASVELVFFVEEDKRAALAALDVFPDEDGILLVTRKILPSRSVSRLNDEAVTTARLRQVTGLLLDIHGQHDHQSLLHAARHSEIRSLYPKHALNRRRADRRRSFRRTGAHKALEEIAGETRRSPRREADCLRFEMTRSSRPPVKRARRRS